jgi:S1-C subfamily serine protease
MVGGDIITSLDGVPVNSETRFRDLIASKKPGDAVAVEIRRGKTNIKLELKLGRLPATTPPSLG